MALAVAKTITKCEKLSQEIQKGKLCLAPTWEICMMWVEGYSHLGYWSTFCVCDVIWENDLFKTWTPKNDSFRWRHQLGKLFCYLLFSCLMQVDLFRFFKRAVSWLIASCKTFISALLSLLPVFSSNVAVKQLVEIAHLTWLESF